MRRRMFLAGISAGASVLAFSRRVAALAQPSPSHAVLPANVRVRLFSGMRVVRVDCTTTGQMSVTSGRAAKSGAAFSLSSADVPAAISSDAPVTIVAHLEGGTSIQRQYLGTFSITIGE